MKKWQSIVILTVLAILIVLGSVFGFVTLDKGELGTTNYFAYITNISLGLDLSGGVYAVYGVDESNLTDEQKDKMSDLIEGTRASLESLLFGKGYAEAQVTVSTNNKIRVEIPDEDDPDRIFNLIGRPSSLEFKEYVDGAEGDLSLNDPNGKVKLDSKITGDDISNTGVSYNDQTGYYEVNLAFTNAGSTKFAAATGALTGSRLSIWINDEFVIAPEVNTTISTGGSISGNYSYDEAYALAVQIQAGAFPLVLKMEESNTITATLGSSAIKAGLISGIVGLVLIFIYLIVMYRLMGLAASLSLWFYSITYLFFLSIFPWVQLTLSGIAGVLLSIGMAVDANVIIFERIKEEYSGGKTMRTSITTGFKRSLGAILDGNITTIIGAVVLIAVGASTIKSFGITLLIGLILSLLSSLLLMRLVLNCFLVFNDESKAKFFGLKREAVEDGEDVVEEQSEEAEAPVENKISKNTRKGGAVR